MANFLAETLRERVAALPLDASNGSRSVRRKQADQGSRVRFFIWMSIILSGMAAVWFGMAFSLGSAERREPRQPCDNRNEERQRENPFRSFRFQGPNRQKRKFQPAGRLEGAKTGMSGGKMKQFLRTIREPEPNPSTRAKIGIGIAVMVGGFLLGIVQKWLDGSAFNELPLLFQRLDLTNFFGRIAVWIFLGTVISGYASTPIQASVNTFLFFISMVSGYYLYCGTILGFFPKAYALIWFALSFASPFFAYICWYAKGKGMVAILISAVILGALFSQAFFLTQGFRVAHWPEVITWAAACVILRRRPKDFALEIGLSLVAAWVFQQFVPYWG